MDPRIEFLQRLKEAAAAYAHAGFNTDVRETARRFGIADQEELLNAIRTLAAPGVLYRELKYEEWLRFESLWVRCGGVVFSDSRDITSE